MATIIQSHKRKPITTGELHSFGASNFINNEWENFTIGLHEYDNNREDDIYTTLKIDRKEAERIVKYLSEYLAGKH